LIIKIEKNVKTKKSFDDTILKLSIRIKSNSVLKFICTTIYINICYFY